MSTYTWEPEDEAAEVADQLDGIQLRYDDIEANETFNDGSIRNSTVAVCVCRALRETIVPEEYDPFPVHLNARGKGFERILSEYLQTNHAATIHREVVIPWEYGETHADLFVTDHSGVFGVPAGVPIMLEVKANKQGKLKPENVRQVRQQWWLTQRALAAGRPVHAYTGSAPTIIDPELLQRAEWIIVVIDPLTWRIPNPQGYKVLVGHEEEEAIAQRFTVIDKYLPILSTLDPFREDDWPECTCSKCHKPHIADLPADIEDTAVVYDLAREAEKEAAAEKKIAQMKLVGQLTMIGKTMGGMHDPYEGNRYRVMLNKKMTPIVTRHSEAKLRRQAEQVQ